MKGEGKPFDGASEVMMKEVRAVQSFEELFTQYFSRVYRFALSLTRDPAQAEDVTQQTFFKALQKVDTFEGRSDVGTWLCSIAKNEYFNRRRRSREVPCAPDDAVFLSFGEDAAAPMERAEQRMQIMRSLHELDEPFREVFMLRVFGELKYAQIASLFGKTESWARVTFYRAKLELQRRVQEDENG